MEQIVEKEWGIKIPRMYRLGFKYANCGGRCVKAGIEHYKRLYLAWPNRFREQEGMERRFREQINDYTILKKYAGMKAGKSIYLPYSLAQLRRDIETNGIQFDLIVYGEQPCECVV